MPLTFLSHTHLLLRHRVVTHSSSLLHGVARVHGASVRYSLILFFARAG